MLIYCVCFRHCCYRHCFQSPLLCHCVILSDFLYWYSNITYLMHITLIDVHISLTYIYIEVYFIISCVGAWRHNLVFGWQRPLSKREVQRPFLLSGYVRTFFGQNLRGFLEVPDARRLWYRASHVMRCTVIVVLMVLCWCKYFCLENKTAVIVGWVSIVVRVCFSPEVSWCFIIYIK
jgi:hypothetical protein